jgi:hypothetical protein
MRSGRSIVLTIGLLVALARPVAIYSCGPFFASAVFWFHTDPASQEEFAAGKLGILRPSLRRSYLVVAYRYMSGLQLSDAQQKQAIAVWNGDVVPEHPGEEESMAAWVKARNAVPNLPPGPQITPFAPVGKDAYYNYVNCAGDAFMTATQTLGARSTKYGAASDSLREWTSAQDTVFSNCGGQLQAIPAVLQTGHGLAKADRAYQTAAAHFYAREFDQAAAGFDAIAQDTASPWSKFGAYLAARAMIRKSTLTAPEGPGFDRAGMAEAQKRLKALAVEKDPGVGHDAVMKLLSYVEFRLEPEKRLAELDREMKQADPGANFKQDLWDYALLLGNGKEGEDPSDWVQTYSALGLNPGGDSDAGQHALAQWRKAKTQAWLVAALTGAKPKAAETGELLDAAQAVARPAPGYLTVRYEALRLMLGEGRDEAARKELDQLLAENEIGLASHNLLNDLRQKATTSFADFLAHAAETPVPSTLNYSTMEEEPDGDEGKPSEPLFNVYAAQVLSKRLPLALLADAAGNSALTPHLRREVARSAWTRAVMLGDFAAADRLQDALKEADHPLWTTMEGFRNAKSPEEKRFAGLFVILSNPGLNPSVRPGLLRETKLAEIDNFRDNWWCASADAPNYGEAYGGHDADANPKAVDRDSKYPFPAWVTEKEKAQAASEWQRLDETGTAPNYLAQQVVAYAKAHPEDAQVPQALHLVVRATRYGCTNAESSRLSKEAFTVLHERYPKSEWAEKTKYYY